MRKNIKTVAVVVLLMALTALPIFALNRKKIAAKCPLDGHSFQTWEVVSKTDWGGIDTDLCRHECGSIQPNDLYVWVCPKCWYAATSTSFNEKLSDADKQKLLGALKPMTELKRVSDQDDIPGWVKYDLLAQTFRLLGKQERHVAEAYLRASWSARQNGADPLNDYDELQEIRESYALNVPPFDFVRSKSNQEKYGANRTFYDLEKVKKLESDLAKGKHSQKSDNLVVRYIIAQIYRRHGVNDEAMKWLSRLQKEAGQNSIIDTAVTKALKSIETETHFQKKAVEAYVKAIDNGDYKSTELPEAQYLAGEISRRIQDDKSAIEWFDKCIANQEAKQYKPLSEARKAEIDDTSGKTMKK